MREIALPMIEQDDDFSLLELAGWSASALDRLLAASGLPVPTVCGDTAIDGAYSVLRLTPTIAWLIGPSDGAPEWNTGDDGAVIDLSNSRLRLKPRGNAGQVLPGLVAVDLARLPAGHFALTPIHGVPVAILVVPGGFDLLVPRSFSADIAAWIDDAASAG